MANLERLRGIMGKQICRQNHELVLPVYTPGLAHIKCPDCLDLAKAYSGFDREDEGSEDDIPGDEDQEDADSDLDDAEEDTFDED